MNIKKNGKNRNFAYITICNQNKRASKRQKDNEMELKEISRTAQNITDTYLKNISNSEYQEDITDMYLVVNSDLDRTIRTSWISEYIGTKAKNVAIQTGVDYQDVLILVKEQFMINAINNRDKDAKFIKKTIEYSAMYVKSVLFSDISKQRKARKGTAFINEDNTQATQIEITIDSTKRATADALLSQQINRKDQLRFIETVLELGEDEAKEALGLDSRSFNKKRKRAEATLKDYQDNHKEDYEYAKALINSMIMSNVSDLEQSENDEIADTYEQLTHQPSFYF